MKDVVYAMILRYGLEDVLTEVGRGIAAVIEDHSSNDIRNKACNYAATEVFHIRNKVREFE